MGSATATASSEYNTITPYLYVDGADRMLDFVQRAFGAQELSRYPRPDGTGIMHAEFSIGDTRLAVADAPPAAVALHLYAEDVDEACRRGIQAGARLTHAVVDQPYGDREGALEDPFGNAWYVATHRTRDAGQTEDRKHIPEGLRTVTVYLHVRGADELIRFLAAAFGAEALTVHREAGADAPIAHAKVRIGDSVVEMSDAHGPYQPKPTAFWLHVDDVDAVYERAVHAGAAVISAPDNKPYGERGAAVKDSSDNTWYIASPLKG